MKKITAISSRGTTRGTPLTPHLYTQRHYVVAKGGNTLDCIKKVLRLEDLPQWVARGYGIRMSGKGVAPSLIDNAARQLGFPVGPLQLVDETSIDLGAKIARATRAAMGDDYPDGAVDEVIFWMEDEATKLFRRYVELGGTRRHDIETLLAKRAQFFGAIQ